MSLFGSLKKTLKDINSEMSEFKKVQTEFLFTPEIIDPTPNMKCLEPEEIDKKISEVECSLKNMKVATAKVDKQYKNRIDNSKRYVVDMEELYFDVNHEYAGVEKFLEQYGYIPPQIDYKKDLERKLPSTSAPTDQIDSQQAANNTTPKLPKMKRRSSSFPDSRLDLVNKDKTPVLGIDLEKRVRVKSKSPKLNLSKTPALVKIAKKLDYK